MPHRAGYGFYIDPSHPQCSMKLNPSPEFVENHYSETKGTNDADGADRQSVRPSSRGGITSTSRRRKGPTPSDSSEEGEPARKRGRDAVDESHFPWQSSSTIQRALLSPQHQEVLDLLDKWSNDPNLVVHKIMLSPGCPDFPVDQWANIIKGRAVDLAKVLGAQYSTSIEDKQSHDIGDLFQLSVQTSKQSKEIQSHGELRREWTRWARQTSVWHTISSRAHDRR